MAGNKFPLSARHKRTKHPGWNLWKELRASGVTREIDLPV
jgi:hypothetical protein